MIDHSCSTMLTMFNYVFNTQYTFKKIMMYWSVLRILTKVVTLQNPLFPSSFQHFCRISPWNRRWLMGWCRVWSWRPTAIKVPYVLISVELFLCFDTSSDIPDDMRLFQCFDEFSYSCVLIWVKLFLCFDMSLAIFVFWCELGYSYNFSYSCILMVWV